MRYTELAAYLAGLATGGDQVLHPSAGGLRLANVPFESRHADLLPGHATYRCAKHALSFTAPRNPNRPLSAPEYPPSLCIADAEVAENRSFSYTLLTPPGEARARGVIVLLHGLNERTWDKYLPWAVTLARRTGKAVLLFPIAFHATRAPHEWADSRTMRRVARLRQAHSPTITNSTLANAAISARLEHNPPRFFWSGLQTFDDLLDLVAAIRAGSEPRIAPDAEIDFFAYSIGAFLCEILLLADPGGSLSDARLSIFCGGPTFDRMYPNSRYILDSDATIALMAFFVERLDSEVKADERLAHYFSASHPAGRSFEMMLSSQKRRAEREQGMRRLGARLAAIALQDDDVVPPAEVLNTLQGGFRDIPIPVDVLQFPFRYSHVVPFPTAGAPSAAVDRAFEAVFERAASHVAFRR